MPNEIASITSLTSIKLFGNKINGSIPVSIGSLEKLKVLDVERNQMSGNLFTTGLFSLASTLTELRVSFNRFQGSVPDLSTFTSLKKLWLGNNTFTGAFPESVTELTGLGECVVLSHRHFRVIMNLFSTLLFSPNRKPLSSRK